GVGNDAVGSFASSPCSPETAAANPAAARSHGPFTAAWPPTASPVTVQATVPAPPVSSATEFTSSVTSPRSASGTLPISDSRDDNVAVRSGNAVTVLDSCPSSVVTVVVNDVTSVSASATAWFPAATAAARVSRAASALSYADCAAAASCEAV